MRRKDILTQQHQILRLLELNNDNNQNDYRVILYSIKQGSAKLMSLNLFSALTLPTVSAILAKLNYMITTELTPRGVVLKHSSVAITYHERDLLNLCFVYYRAISKSQKAFTVLFNELLFCWFVVLLVNDAALTTRSYYELFSLIVN